MEEGVIGRLRRREGVGLVQEAADGDTGHSDSRATRKAATLALCPRQAQANKQFRICMTLVLVSSRHRQFGIPGLSVRGAPGMTTEVRQSPQRGGNSRNPSRGRV